MDELVYLKKEDAFTDKNFGKLSAPHKVESTFGKLEFSDLKSTNMKAKDIALIS